MKKVLISEDNQYVANRIINNPLGVVGIISPKGAGKQSFIEYLGEQILSEGSAQYLKKITASSKEAMETAKSIRKFLSLTVPGKKTIKRVVTIADFEHFGHEAQNSLLKAFEELNTDTVIIISVSNSINVLDTIKSRAKWYKLRPVRLNESFELLPQYDRGTIEKNWHISQGSLGLLIDLLQADKEHNLAKSIEKAKELLQSKRYERLIQIEPLTKDTESVHDLLDAMARLLRSALLQKAKKADNYKVNSDNLANQLNLVLRSQEKLASKTNSKIVLTSLFFSL